ncbi:sulfatase-like hydrolase/transferase, partial [Pirellulaceae bacterium]|nr:sulfatase-like hydrolase/transferase [Pirellulaceae bacterium]
MNFLQSILILLFLAGVISGQDTERPNVLMIVVDDMNDWVGCLAGHPDTRTPNIDRLAQRGTLFSNAHCAAPVCNPSRVSTLTGLRPSTTGIYDNSVKWPQQLANIESLPRHFKRNGYQVFGGGKVYHHMPGFNRSSDWHFYFKQRFDGHYQSLLHAGKDTTNFHFPSGFPLNQLDAVRDLKRPPRNPREFDWGPLDKAIQETGDGQMIEWAVESLKSNQPTPFLM